MGRGLGVCNDSQAQENGQAPDLSAHMLQSSLHRHFTLDQQASARAQYCMFASTSRVQHSLEFMSRWEVPLPYA